MSDEQRNAKVIGSVAERWNSGDIEGMLDLYDPDIEMIASPEWPDPGTSGKDAFARYADEWREAWESATIDLSSLQARGETVLALGAWETRGAASGIGGSMPFGILFSLRDGLVTRHQWFTNLDEARVAAAL